MNAPILNRLNESLRKTENPIDKGVLAAEIACYLARVGEFEEADRLRLDLREQFGDGHCPRVSILIMCIEAFLFFFGDLDKRGWDRLRRANILSVACRETSLVALTSAWLAHFEFNAGRFEAMLKQAENCVAALSADNGAATCRLSLVLGDAFLYAGRDDCANKWHDFARVAANRLGDQAAIGAITYNRAALHVAAARIRDLGTNVTQAEIALLGTEVRSAASYQTMARLRSLDHLLRSANIGVLMLAKDFKVAAQEILQLVASSAVPSGSAQLALLYADQAHSMAKLGEVDLARSLSAAALGTADIDEFDADDRALIFGALAEFNEAASDQAAAQSLRELSKVAQSQHARTINGLAKLLEPFESGPNLPVNHQPA